MSDRSQWNDDLLFAAAERARRYQRELPGRSVAPSRAALAALQAHRLSSLPLQGESPQAVLQELDEVGAGATVASTGARYFGFVTGGALPAAVAANWLATAWDQNGFSTVSSPVATHFSELSLRWVRALLGLPEEAAGVFVGGAALASFTAMAAARRSLFLKHGHDVDALGLCGAPPITVACSADIHPTVLRGLGLLGLGRVPTVSLPTDDQGRIQVDRLPPLQGPALVCAQAGNVNTGASDRFAVLRAYCDKYGAWLHVDGAFGLWAAAVPQLRPQVAGVELADSWAVDAHKWLNVPYDSAIAFVRDGELLRQCMGLQASYLPTEGNNPIDYSPQSSTRARGVDTWAALRSLGQDGVRALIWRCCELAQRFARGIKAGGYDVLNDVVLNQVLLNFGDQVSICEAIAARVRDEGVCWVGTGRYRGRPVIRISVSSWATTAEDVDRSVDALLRAAAVECV